MDIAIPFPLLETQEKERVTEGSWIWITLGKRRVFWLFDCRGLKRIRVLSKHGTKVIVTFECDDFDIAAYVLAYKNEKDRRPFFTAELAQRFHYTPSHVINLQLSIL